MQNDVYITIGIVLLLLSSPIFAQATDSFESSLQDKGYADLSVTGKNKRECARFNFLDQGLGQDFYSGISLELVFEPTANGTARTIVTLNDEKIAETKSNELSCSTETQCHFSVWPDQNKIQEENILEVCLVTSDTIAEAMLLNSSTIGFYKTAIVRPYDFNQSTLKTEYAIGEDIPITISVHNSGSDVAVVDVNFARPVTENLLHALTVVGDTYYEQVRIPPKQTRTFSYTAKIDIEHELIGFVPASLTHTDIFGDRHEVLSNYLLVQVLENIDVAAGLLVENASLPVNGESHFQVLVTNNSTQPIFDVRMGLIRDKNTLLLDRDLNVDIAKLNVGETKEISFKATSGIENSYTINCFVEHQGQHVTACEQIVLDFRDSGITLLLLQGLVLAVIAILAFVVLYRK